MTKNKTLLKNGLVFSAAVAGSILGNYHRAYSACTSTVVNGGQSFTCEGGDITINTDISPDANNAAVKVLNEGEDNNINLTIGSNVEGAAPIAIQAQNAVGVYVYNHYSMNDGDITVSIGSNVTISNTSDGDDGHYNYKEAVSIINYSNQGSTNVTINGDVEASPVGENFDDAVKIKHLNSNGGAIVNIGESSNIQATGGGQALYVSSTSGANVTISGDLTSESANFTGSVQSFGNNANLNITIASTSEINATGATGDGFLASINPGEIGDIALTVNGTVTSNGGSAVRISGSSATGNLDSVTFNAGANITGKTAAISVDDTSATINLVGGTDFSSEDNADIVRLTGTNTNKVAILLPGSVYGGGAAANNTVNVSGNVVVVGDIIGGEHTGDNDSINLDAANLTLSNSDVTEFENINVEEDSNLTLTNNSSINATITADTDKTLNLTLNASSLNGGGGNSATLGSGEDNLTITGASAITGNFNAGDGSDNLTLSDATLTLNGGATFTNFENITLSGTNQITGAFNVSADVVTMEAGLLTVNGGIQGVNGSAMNMTIDGGEEGATITAAGGAAINFANQDDSLTLQGEVTFNGDVNGGAGVDTLSFNGATVNLADGSEFSAFENLELSGENILNGDVNLNGVTLSNDAGAILEMNGTITSTSLTLGDGFTLNGNFEIDGDLTVGDGATISPGAMNSGIGTATINGNLVFEPNSTLSIDVDGDNSDSLVVTGAVDILDGANLLINPTGNATSGSARILQATGGINGSFSNILSTDGSNITLLYSANNLELNYVTLNTNTLSSQIQASVDNSILFSDTLNKQISRGAFAKGRNFWVRNIYRDRDVDSSSSSVGFTDNAYGIAFGAENDIDDSIKVGFAAASIDGNLNVAGNQGGRDSQSFFAAAYANYKTTNNLFASLALTLGYHDNKNSRLVNNSGVESYAKSSSHDKEIGLNFQVGKKFTVKNVWNIMPKFSASYIKTLAGKFSESASEAGNAAISVEDYELSTLKFREAVRFERASFFKLSGVEFSPYLEVGFAQERSMGDRQVAGSFQVANQRFNAKLKTNNRSFVTGAAGFSMQINKDVSAFVSYENAVSNQETRNDVNAGVSIKF